jgi:hypothetical protein
MVAIPNKSQQVSPQDGQISSAKSFAHGEQLWSTPEWQEQALSWVDSHLANHGYQRSGGLARQRVQPWATVLKIPTDHGTVWMKAAAPSTAFEIRLYPLLQKVFSKWILRPIAVDLDRGWMLLPDGGTCLAEMGNNIDPVRVYETVLPCYGELQLALATHTQEMVECGVSDMRAPMMPMRFQEAVCGVRDFVELRGTPEEHEQFRKVLAMEPTFLQWCSQLADIPGLPSLDHNDLHGGNILISATSPSLCFHLFDWGDSVIAHPFTSMLVAVGLLRRNINATTDTDPRILRVRDAYLEAFSGIAPKAELIHGMELACRVAKVTRTLTWLRAVGTPSSPVSVSDPRLLRIPFECLCSLTEESYLGRH